MYIEFVLCYIFIGVLAILQIVNLILNIIILKSRSNNRSIMMLPNSYRTNGSNSEIPLESIVFCPKCATEYSLALKCCPRCGSKRR